MKKHWTRLAALVTAACLLTVSVPAADESGETAPSGADGTLGMSGVAPCEGVVIPTDFFLTIDPYQVAGREQVYSGYIRIVNNNDYPVEVEMTDLCVTANDPWVAVRGAPVDLVAGASDEKDICLYLRCLSGRGFDEELLIGESSPGKPIRFTLGASDGVSVVPADWGVTLGASGGIPPTGHSQAVFQIVGTVNAYPFEEWRAGDVSVTMSFAARPAEGFDPLPLADEAQPEVELPLEEIDTPLEEPGATIGASET